VPIINPALATWREHLEACRESAPIRAVKILPNYHGYGLRSRRLEPFMEALSAANLRLILTARLEDERQTYFGLRIKGVPADHIAAFLARFALQQVFCTGLYASEIEQLAATAGNFSSDISFAESRATLPLLRKALPLRRLMFGSGVPLLSVHAQAAKIRHHSLSAGEREMVANRNARRFFAL
jgi:predicted TIM-barrel fold metal-dependent hydrolase